jgi:mono/diheme cytochrome c family protein
MYKGFLHTHTLVVTLFLLIYVIKTILLLGNKKDVLQKFTKVIKVPEMIISALFLITGIYLATQQPFGGKYDYLLWVKIAMVMASIPLAVIGFKKANKVLAALSLLLITGSYGLAEVYAKRKAIQVEKPIAVSTDGYGLYEANCALCHGTNGDKGVAGAANLRITAMDAAELKKVILKGKGSMPAIQVSEEDAQSITDYVNEKIKGQ